MSCSSVSEGAFARLIIIVEREVAQTRNDDLYRTLLHHIGPLCTRQLIDEMPIWSTSELSRIPYSGQIHLAVELPNSSVGAKSTRATDEGFVGGDEVEHGLIDARGSDHHVSLWECIGYRLEEMVHDSRTKRLMRANSHM
jgi:hypothetical protein